MLATLSCLVLTCLLYVYCLVFSSLHLCVSVFHPLYLLIVTSSLEVIFCWVALWLGIIIEMLKHLIFYCRLKKEPTVLFTLLKYSLIWASNTEACCSILQLSQLYICVLVVCHTIPAVWCNMAVWQSGLLYWDFFHWDSSMNYILGLSMENMIRQGEG